MVTSASISEREIGGDVDASPKPTADMNITPMIDVLLVLLVIFMAAVPLMQRSIDVALPPESPPHHEPPPSQIVAEMGPNRELTINHQPVAMSELDGRLRTIFEGRRDKTLYVSASAGLAYGDVMALIDAAKGAGVARVGIITEGMRKARSGS
jgi:biopolymer transport protein ExbD